MKKTKLQLSKIFNNYINERKLNAIKSGHKSFYGFINNKTYYKKNNKTYYKKIIRLITKKVFLNLLIQPITLLHLILINMKLL